MVSDNGASGFLGMEVKRERFLQRLSSVRHGLSPKESAQQDNCFVFQNGQVFTCNEEVACRTKSGLPDDLECAVLAEPLLRHLELLPDDDLMISLEGDNLVVAGKGRNVEVRSQSEVVLDLSSVEEPKESSWRPLPEDFEEACTLAAACCGDDESKYLLMFVHARSDLIEASDSRMLLRYRIELPITGDHLVKPKPLKAAAESGVTEIAETEAWLHFRHPSGLLISCLRQENQAYPDLSKILAFEGESLTLPGGLADEVAAAALSSGELKDDDKVWVELRPGKLRVHGYGVASNYHATKKVSYKGPKLNFRITPKVLQEVAKKHKECVVSPDKLRVSSGKWDFSAFLWEATRKNAGEKVTTTTEEGGEE